MEDEVLEVMRRSKGSNMCRSCSRKSEGYEVASVKCPESVRSHHLGGPANHQVVSMTDVRLLLKANSRTARWKDVGGSVGVLGEDMGGEWERGEVSSRRQSEGVK